MLRHQKGNHPMTTHIRSTPTRKNPFVAARYKAAFCARNLADLAQRLSVAAAEVSCEEDAEAALELLKHISDAKTETTTAVRYLRQYVNRPTTDWQRKALTVGQLGKIVAMLYNIGDDPAEMRAARRGEVVTVKEAGKPLDRAVAEQVLRAALRRHGCDESAAGWLDREKIFAHLELQAGAIYAYLPSA